MPYAKEYPAIGEVRAPDVSINFDGDSWHEMRPYLLVVAAIFIFVSILVMML